MHADYVAYFSILNLGVRILEVNQFKLPCTLEIADLNRSISELESCIEDIDGRCVCMQDFVLILIYDY